MRRSLPVLLLALLPALAAGQPGRKAEDKPTPPPAVGVVVTPVAGGVRTDAVVPGHLIAVALPRDTAGRRRIVALTSPEAPPAPEDAEDDGDTPEGPRSLFLIDPGQSGPPRLLLRAGLPPESDALAAADLDGDGAEEVLLGEPGRLHSLGTPENPTSPRLLLSAPGLDLRRRSGSGGRFEAAAVGRFRTWQADGSGRLTPGLELELPVRAARERTGLRLTTPPVTAIPRRDAAPLWAAGPETEGRTRLRTVLLEPEKSENGGETRRTESWSRLPSPEQVERSWYVTLDGRPALIVTTFDAEKLGLFEKKKLRVFLLGADRSRSGSGPVLAVQTESHRWQAVDPVVLDLDRDGHDDLVVIQPEGLAGGDLVVEAWFGKGGGRFEPSSRRTVLKDLAIRTWSYGQDLTGDGYPDLAAIREGRLLAFAGTASPRREILDRRPRHTFELPAGAGTLTTEVSIGTGGTEASVSGAAVAPHPTDLDGDGRLEVLLFAPSQKGRGRVTAFRFER